MILQEHGLIVTDPIENEGIQMGIELAKEADLCLFVHPANQELGVIVDLQKEINHVPSYLVTSLRFG